MSRGTWNKLAIPFKRRPFYEQKIDILYQALESGIIDADSVLDTLMSTKREQIMKMHTYAITPPAKESGRWQTCYKDASGKRKNIKAQTKEELLDKLIPIYFSDSHIDNLTFYGLYEEWLEYKVTVTNSPNMRNGERITARRIATILRQFAHMRECPLSQAIRCEKLMPAT